MGKIYSIDYYRRKKRNKDPFNPEFINYNEVYFQTLNYRYNKSLKKIKKLMSAIQKLEKKK